MSKFNELHRLLLQGKINRREFITQVSALGLLATLTPSFMASTVSAATPKKGGRFRMGLTGGTTGDSMDPATLTDVMNVNLNYCVRQNLVEVDYDGKVIPELAESWEASSDAAKWSFKLRKDVEFHNGKIMTSEDVIYSLNHHRAEGSKSGAKALLEQIVDMNADGKYEVVFTLQSGNADFPYILNDYHLLIVPKDSAGDQWNQGIGTGGYILQKWEPGVSAFLKRNPNYWKKNRAHFDEVEILSISDEVARTTALKTGKIDYMDQADIKTAHLMKKQPGVKVIRVPSSTHITMPMLTDVAPFNNNDLRLAMKYAVDRKQLVEKVLGGYGTLGNDHPILTQRYYASDLPQRQYDPDKAMFHLKKAGMESGRTFELHASEQVGFMDIAVLFKEQAAKAGINIKVVKHPVDGYWSAIWMKKPFVMCYWGGRPTCDMQFSTGYLSQASWNDTHFKNKRFDELVLKARTELDEKKRHEMYVECQRILRDEGGTIIPAFKDFVEAASSKMRYDKIAGNWMCDGAHAAERWWFDA